VCAARFAMLESMTAPQTRNPVVEVNGEIIYADEIRGRMALLRAQAEASGRELSADERFALRPQAIEELVDRLLLRQEAMRLKLVPTEAEIDAALAKVAPKYDGSEGCRADFADTESREDIAARLLVDRLLGRWFESVHPPKIHEMREFYRKNQESFRAPELIAASHIVKHVTDDSGEALVAGLRNSILAGEDFAAIAQRFSDCPEKGGDLGYFPRGVMVEEFDEVAFAAPIGHVTPPFRTRFGWHIMLVRDRKPEGIRTFEEVAEQIQNRMLLERQEREVGVKMTTLRRKARYVEIGRL